MKAIWQGNREDLTLKSHQLQQSQSIVWLPGLNYTGSVILCHSLKAERIIIEKCNTVGHTTKGRCVWVDSTHQMWVLSVVIAGRLYGSEKAIYRYILLMESKWENAEVLERKWPSANTKNISLKTPGSKDNGLCNTPLGNTLWYAHSVQPTELALARSWSKRQFHVMPWT